MVKHYQMRLIKTISAKSVDASTAQTPQTGLLQMVFQPTSIPQAVAFLICIFADPQPFPGAGFLAMPCKMDFGSVEAAA